MALKLRSVFFCVLGDTFELVEFAEEVFNEVAPFVDLEVDIEWREPSRALRNHDYRAARVHVVDNPGRVEGLVGEDGAEFDTLD